MMVRTLFAVPWGVAIFLIGTVGAQQPTLPGIVQAPGYYSPGGGMMYNSVLYPPGFAPDWIVAPRYANRASTGPQTGQCGCPDCQPSLPNLFGIAFGPGAPTGPWVPAPDSAEPGAPGIQPLTPGQPGASGAKPITPGAQPDAAGAGAGAAEEDPGAPAEPDAAEAADSDLSLDLSLQSGVSESQYAFTPPQIGGDSNVGYIDRAIVSNLFRLRFDAAYNNTRPDRVEFLYAKCGCFGLGADSPGPPLPETSVDYQVIQADLEYVLADRWSAFIEAPIRFLNPEQNDNTVGLSDLQAGFKFALWNCEHRAVTFQLRTYIPTGDADRGLGTHHVSLEPAILWYERVSDRLSLEAEFRDWIPIGASSAAPISTGSFSGSILRYGIGLGYTLVEDCNYRLTPVAEFVGWTVLDGFATVSSDGTPANTNPAQAGGDTMINFKIGTRLAFGDEHSFYAGYGRALTGDTWYDDVLRVEYRTAF